MSTPETVSVPFEDVLGSSIETTTELLGGAGLDIRHFVQDPRDTEPSNWEQSFIAFAEAAVVLERVAYKDSYGDNQYVQSSVDTHQFAGIQEGMDLFTDPVFAVRASRPEISTSDVHYVAIHNKGSLVGYVSNFVNKDPSIPLLPGNTPFIKPGVPNLVCRKIVADPVFKDTAGPLITIANTLIWGTMLATTGFTVETQSQPDSWRIFAKSLRKFFPESQILNPQHMESVVDRPQVVYIDLDGKFERERALRLLQRMFDTEP